MTQSAKESPVSELLFLQYQELSRQILIEERLYFALFIVISITLAAFQANGMIFFFGFGLIIASSSLAFMARYHFLRRRLQHLEQAIVNLDHSMLEYYVKSMSFRYYEGGILSIVNLYSRALLPAVAGTLLMIRYLIEVGFLNIS